VSTADKPDLARGWEHVEDLLAAEELERLESLGDAELDAEMKAAGLDAKQLPTAAELVALGAERAKQPDAARGWKHVEKLLAEDDEAYAKEVARLEGLSDEALDAEMRAEGLDVTSLPTAAELVAKGAERAARKAVEGGVEQGADVASQRSPASTEGPEPARAVPGSTKVVPFAAPNRSSRTAWALVAAAIVLLAFFAYKNRRAIVAWWSDEPIRPDDQWLPWKPARTPQERAATLRDEAVGECAAARWQSCRDKLDEAQKLDPAGESEPRVSEARRAIERAEHPERRVPDKPEPDKAPFR
jgi:hypothetical protein